MAISPQGYNINENPINVNPFWEHQEADGSVTTVRARKDETDTETVYTFDYIDTNGEVHEIIRQVFDKTDAAVFTPNVENGVLSWTNNAGLPNPPAVSIMGPSGPRGLRGIAGPKGDPGTDGKDGKNGVSPVIVSTPVANGYQLSITTEQGTEEIIISNGEKGDKGERGEMAFTIGVGSVTTGEAGSSASVVNSGTEQDIILDFTIPRGNTGAPGSRGDAGPRGERGEAATVNAGTVTILDPNEAPYVNNSGTRQDAVFNFGIPRGPQGIQGERGEMAFTIGVGSVTTGEAGSSASVVNSGTEQDIILDFTIPRGNTGSKGDAGPRGERGEAATVNAGTVTILDPNEAPYVNNSGTRQDAVFNFGIPQGPQGIQGERGEMAFTIGVGSVTTGEAGSSASVVNSGTEQDIILDFTIPRGNTGSKGDAGPRGEAATVKAGTVTILDPNEAPYVNNSGTRQDAVFNFGIPQAVSQAGNSTALLRGKAINELNYAYGGSGHAGGYPTVNFGSEEGNVAQTFDPNSLLFTTLSFTNATAADQNIDIALNNSSENVYDMISGSLGNGYAATIPANSEVVVPIIFRYKGAQIETAEIPALKLAVSAVEISKDVNLTLDTRAHFINYKGLKGDPGPRGETALTIGIGSVTEGSAASVVNSGTDQDIVLDFVIPKGSDGAPGADGVTPNITATASVSSEGSVGVNVTKTGTNANPNFDFAFSGIGGGGSAGGGVQIDVHTGTVKYDSFNNDFSLSLQEQAAAGDIYIFPFNATLSWSNNQNAYADLNPASTTYYAIPSTLQLNAGSGSPTSSFKCTINTNLACVCSGNTDTLKFTINPSSVLINGSVKPNPYKYIRIRQN